MVMGPVLKRDPFTKVGSQLLLPSAGPLENVTIGPTRVTCAGELVALQEWYTTVTV
jgi:hypothetical protein